MDQDRRAVLAAFEKRIGYEFRDAAHLNTALTHTSYVKGDGNDCKHNERLEFLGDAVLELCVSEFLFNNYPDMNEGLMTRTRAIVVCEPTLSKAAKAIELGSVLLLGRGEEHSGGRDKPSILSDALEAVIGAIFLDGGFEPAKRFIMSFTLTNIRTTISGSNVKDYKTMLQEYVQKRHLGCVNYVLNNTTGPDHKKTFEMEAVINGERMGNGTGGTKQEAGQQAARAALEKLGGHIADSNALCLDKLCDEELL